MNDPREFDELARHKLAERDFTFDEAHWTAMRELLDGQRRKRRPLAWVAAALLVSAPLAWVTLSEDETVANEVVQSAVTPEEKAPQSGTTITTALPGTPANNTSSEGDPVVPSVRSVAPEIGSSAVPASKRQLALAEPTPDEPQTTLTTNSASHLNEAAPISVPKAAAPAPMLANDPAEPTVPAQAIIAAQAPDAASNEEPTVVQEGSEQTADGGVEPPVSSGTGLVNDTVPPDPTLGTSTDVVAASLVLSDSISAPLEPTTSWVAPSGHWELSALMGSTFSTSRYSGEKSADWSADMTGEWSPGYGLELARVNRHFGFGTGVHHVTYEERLRREQLATTEELHSLHYSLMPVNVTIAVVTDTFEQGGVIYYVTTPLDTTINQLVSDVDTTYLTVVRREARDQVNRVSYWEVPLFAEARTSKGRWSFGVRGGPTVGFLSSHKGVVPNIGDNGYTDLSDRMFRSTVLGYSGRAFARYRLFDAWSVGVEPTVRGQFGNALEGDGLARHTSAWGAYFSVNYRLP